MRPPLVHTVSFISIPDPRPALPRRTGSEPGVWARRPDFSSAERAASRASAARGGKLWFWFYFLWSIWSGEYQQYQLSVLNIISSGSWFMVKLNKILLISVLNIVTVLKHWTSVCSVFDGAEVQEFFLKQELFVVAAAAGARINKLTGANKSFLFFQTSWPKNIMTGLK